MIICKTLDHWDSPNEPGLRSLSSTLPTKFCTESHLDYLSLYVTGKQCEFAEFVGAVPRSPSLQHAQDHTPIKQESALPFPHGTLRLLSR